MKRNMLQRLVVVALIVFLVVAEAQNAFAQWSQQGSKLVGAGAVGQAYQGNSVSLSSDGNTAIVSGPGDNGDMGAVWVYTRTGSTWSQQGNKLVGTGAVGEAHQGSVCISSDGNSLIVGGQGDNGGIGAAWVFTRTGGVWSQQGNKIVGTGAVGNAGQGYSVAISADGNTALVGGTNDNNGVGAAWVFTRSGGVWTQQGPKLVGVGATGVAHQGFSVSISGDGNTAIVGGFWDNNFTGAAWVFTRSNGAWSQQGSKLVGTGAVGGAGQGHAVSLSSDGNTALVGGHIDNGIVGAAWVFTRTAGVWSQQGNKIVGSGAMGESNQGNAVSLSGDGNTAIIGASGYSSGGVGAAWVFMRNGGVWTQQGSKLVVSDAVGPNVYQGGSVSISSDGNTAILGGGGDNSRVGAAWVFVKAPTAPSLIANGTFDQSTSNWTVYSAVPNGISFSTLPGGPSGSFAKVHINATSNNMQLYQTYFPLTAGKRYTLGFDAYSPTSRRVFVTVHKHGAPYSSYGFGEWIQLGPNWTHYERQFTAAGFSGTTSDTRLRFYFVYACGAGDDYYFDNVSLVQVVAKASDEQVAGQPTTFLLAQNYPNPFNPTTTIRFSVPNDCHATLKVFDVLGREVATLVNEARAAGSYAETFDASKISSGTYFYRIEAGNFVQTKRMMIIR